MRGLEAVWRGASRHQCLIICLPISLPLNHKTTQNSVGKKSGVGMVEVMRWKCGDGEVEWNGEEE